MTKTPAEPTHPESRKPYTTPTLADFGKVAALTQRASCNGSDDSATVTGCDPSVQRNMNGSDRRFKDNIVRVGTHPLGIGLYLFDYKPEFHARCGEGRRLGVMADEVLAVAPAAVGRDEDGFMWVDYQALGIEPSLH